MIDRQIRGVCSSPPPFLILLQVFCNLTQSALPKRPRHEVLQEKVSKEPKQYLLPVRRGVLEALGEKILTHL